MNGDPPPRPGTASARSARHVLDRLRHRFADSEVIDAEAAQRAAREAGFHAIAEIGDRSKVRITGFVSSQVIQPRGAAPVVEVDIYDGTGTITLIWLGRETISGVGPGARLIVRGFAAKRGNHRVMYNPRYEILAPSGEALAGDPEQEDL